MLHVHGPERGNIHDTTLLRLSKLMEKAVPLLEGAREQLGKRSVFSFFGDGAYAKSKYLLSPFTGPNKTVLEKLTNRYMSNSRIAVEWGFGAVLSQFPLLDRWKLHRLLNTSCVQWYELAVLLCNFLNCYRPNQIAQYFNCEPLSIEEYLGLPAQAAMDSD